MYQQTGLPDDYDGLVGVARTAAQPETGYAPPTSWAVERRLGGGVVLRLGTVRWVGNGYRFTPNVSGRKPSRKVHPTIADSLPRWVGYPNRCETRAL